MLYNTLYSGSKIDELLEFGRTFKSIMNGWVKLTSDETDKINIDNLLNPGNYSCDYWENSPSGVTYDSPLKIITSYVDDEIYQHIFSMGYNVDLYRRKYNKDTEVFDEWENVITTSAVMVGDAPPENPSVGEFWINTTDSDSVINYYSKDGTWKTGYPYDYMDPAIYTSTKSDFPNGIYDYIDECIKDVGSSGDPIDYDSHINNSSIHITKSDKAAIDNKPTTESLLESVESIGIDINVHIAEAAEDTGIDMPEFNTHISNVNSTINLHTRNQDIHPSEELRSQWDRAADIDHTHTKEEITINTNDVIGTYSIDQLPPCNSKHIQLNSLEDMLNLTTDDVTNGDFVFVVFGENDNTLYQVVDESKLGTIDAFVQFNSPMTILSWDDIENKPDSIEHLGLDTVTSSNLTKLTQSLDSKKDAVTNDLSDANLILSNDYPVVLESLIDMIDLKVKIINNIVDKA